jgi:hypothetical protein
MAGTKGKSGGARPGAGRKSRDRECEIDAALEKAATPDALEIVWRSLISKAQASDIKAITLLFAYKYGRPPMMDEAEIEARVEVELDAIINKVEQVLGKDSAQKVIEAIACDSG